MVRQRSRLETVVWPGFVDVLTALLLVVFLVFFVMTVRQFTSSVTSESGETRFISLTEQLAMSREAQTTQQQQLASLKEILDQAQSQGLLTESDAVDKNDLQSRLLALTQHLQEISNALEASKQQNQALKAELLSLGKELNSALATRAQELSRYKSEFFGNLRAIIGANPDITIINDRFLIQSEILFKSGTATIDPSGQEQIRQVVDILKPVIAKFPPEIDWIIRIDGHTDNWPITSQLYPSNLELSLARAVSVARLMAQFGIEEKRLIPSGFSSFRPLNPDNTVQARRQNRRIEMRITQY